MQVPLPTLWVCTYVCIYILKNTKANSISVIFWIFFINAKYYIVLLSHRYIELCLINKAKHCLMCWKYDNISCWIFDCVRVSPFHCFLRLRQFAAAMAFFPPVSTNQEPALGFFMERRLFSRRTLRKRTTHCPKSVIFPLAERGNWSLILYLLTDLFKWTSMGMEYIF